MTPVQRLATSARPLAEVLVDRLREGIRRSRFDRLRHYRDNDGDEYSGDTAAQAELPLGEDEEQVNHDEPPLQPLRPDEAAAAILLGRGLDENRKVLSRLQDRTTIAVIEVPSPDFVDLVERLLRDFVLGGEVTILDGDHCTAGDKIAAAGSVILFSRDAETGKKTLSQGNAAFGAAVQRRCPIIGLAADPDRVLPSDLVKLADDRLTLPPLDADAISEVIKTVTGRKPKAVDEKLGRAVTLGALLAAVRADLGAEGSLKRLQRLFDRDLNASSALRLADLHGLGAARVWGETLASDLRDYQAGRLAWSGVDRGCLLTGAPGTGKTTFAKVLAHEAGVHFIATSYSEWQSNGDGHLGYVTKAIRKIFEDARRNKPAIVFIDEIDAIPARGSSSQNTAWWDAITTCLLVEIDGYEQREGIVVIAASNSPSIDAALKRAGRLDRQIEIPLPDHPALMGIFRTHLGGDLQGVDLRTVALAARGRTGADVERYVREARRAARKAARPLALQELLDVVRDGAPDWPAEVRRRISYHEAGHAIAELALGTGEPTAISINGGGGLSEASRNEIRALTRDYLESHLIALLAGRAAEMLVFGDATAGAGGGEDSDLSKVTHLALQIEGAYGLGQNGPLWLGEATNPRDLLLMPEMRAAVRRTIEAAEIAATELLTRNRPALDALAQTLFVQGYLDRAEIDAVLANVPLAPGRSAPGRRGQSVTPTYGSAEATNDVTGPGQGPNADTAPHPLT